jgi:hypothetical protein
VCEGNEMMGCWQSFYLFEILPKCMFSQNIAFFLKKNAKKKDILSKNFGTFGL